MSTDVASLKSTSGAGFSFEDKVAAFLMCEMLTGIRSLGKSYGTIQRLERQALDWEPLGDLLLTVEDSGGLLVKCGTSVKSNRQFTKNGCNAELHGDLWTCFAKQVFVAGTDLLAVFGAPLIQAVGDRIHTLCKQARELEPSRLEQKVVHEDARKIYESFRCPTSSGDDGLPGRILAHFSFREFDFEATVSRSEVEALKLCRESLSVETQNSSTEIALWKELLDIAEDLRLSGGAITRERLSEKLRGKFSLRDDPCDASAWARIRAFSLEGMDEISSTLPEGLELPRIAEIATLRSAVSEGGGCHVLGDSGSGKSALVKKMAGEMHHAGTEVIWLRADRFLQLLASVPDFLQVAQRCRRPSRLLVVDALDNCNTSDSLKALGRAVATLTGEGSKWSAIVTCQMPEWPRIATSILKELLGNPVVTKRVECSLLGNDDFKVVCQKSPSVARLSREPQLRRILSSPKMLDVLLTGQLAEDRSIAGEADLVEWWWEQQVRGAKPIAAEEQVASQLASRMADELCSELPPASVTGAEEAASALIHNRVLRRTSDGLLRFDHELLADWSRVMHLKGLGAQLLPFLLTHTENPPWLRAIRLLSQHFLDRGADFERWRDVLTACNVTEKNSHEPPAANLQVIDAWLSGIIFSVDPTRALEQAREDLFSNKGWFLQRLLRRLMYTGTIPDPVLQERFQQLAISSPESVGALFRLPLWNLWEPVAEFLIANGEQATDAVPVEIAEMSPMWARMEEYIGVEWKPLAELMILNAEKELRREIAGQYRHDSGPRSLGGGNNSRIAIYAGALHASSQLPDRAATLLLKAAGRVAWEPDDLKGGVEERWLGIWHEPHAMHRGDAIVDLPVSAWPDGPTRETSRDFRHAWLESGAAQVVFRKNPEAATSATLGFLLQWPKRTIIRRDHYGSGVDHHGFEFEAGDMYPAFYSKGPFLQFLRGNWRVAIDLVVRLVNFATDRYTEWWPYENRPEWTTFTTPVGNSSWLGNQQIYGWHRENANTVEILTCALMALEKWLEDEIVNAKSIKEPVEYIYTHGRSLAFAGLLVSLGKRHPKLFIGELKPLIFVHDFHQHDLSSTHSFVGGDYWARDGELVNKLRREWAQLPGRKTSLFELCQQWFVTLPEIEGTLEEVGLEWQKLAADLPEGDGNKIVMQRWASCFDRSNWKETEFEDGQKGWRFDQPAELQDVEGAKTHSLRQALLVIPYQCAERLEKRIALSDSDAEAVWNQVHAWDVFEKAAEDLEEDELSSSLRDPRHARAGLLAVLICLGAAWLDKDPSRRPWVEDEIRKLIADPPAVRAYTADDIHNDAEGFLARAAIQCWARAPKSAEWRIAVATHATAFRYLTVTRLFQEAILVRKELGPAFLELEALALAFSVVRKEAGVESYKPNPKIIAKWGKKWLPRFSKGCGPEWAGKWDAIEIKEQFRPPFNRGYRHAGQVERSRRDYGVEVRMLLAAFGTLPPLQEARDPDERRHWMHICGELLAAYLRTLPENDPAIENDKWKYNIWSADEKIFDILSSRLFQSTVEEQRLLWQPVMDLPPAAHHHIARFLNSILLESIRTEPARISQLIPIWRAIAEHLFSAPGWTGALRHGQDEVWRNLFLYGTPFSTVGQENYIPLVEGLRDLFEKHIRAMGNDAYQQSSLLNFLAMPAGKRILVDALEWLESGWLKARPYFWETAAERGSFASFLECAWKDFFPVIRARPNALKAFKVLTLSLAAHHVSIALEIQKQIGT